MKRMEHFDSDNPGFIVRVDSVAGVDKFLHSDQMRGYYRWEGDYAKNHYCYRFTFSDENTAVIFKLTFG